MVRSLSNHFKWINSLEPRRPSLRRSRPRSRGSLLATRARPASVSRAPACLARRSQIKVRDLSATAVSIAPADYSSWHDVRTELMVRSGFAFEPAGS